jgi:hypothetical protein
LRSFSLAQLALIVRQRLDLSGQGNTYLSANNALANITDTELASIINACLPKTWNLLIRKFGDNYQYQKFTMTTVQGTAVYQLPFDFYKILGVDVLDANGLPVGIKPYNIHERNLYASINSATYSYLGYSNLRYQLQGQNLSFIPTTGPYPNSFIVHYSPMAPILVNQAPLAWAALTAFTAGQQVSVSVTVGGITANQVFIVNTAGTTGAAPPAWNVPGLTTDATVIWSYQAPASSVVTYFDGISGYEEHLILQSAMICGVKQEMDVSSLMAQLQEEEQRIEADAANRQAGDPFAVTRRSRSQISMGGCSRRTSIPSRASS